MSITHPTYSSEKVNRCNSDFLLNSDECLSRCISNAYRSRFVGTDYTKKGEWRSKDQQYGVLTYLSVPNPSSDWILAMMLSRKYAVFGWASDVAGFSDDAVGSPDP